MRLLVGERRRLAISFHQLLADQSRLVRVVSAEDPRGRMLVSSAEVLTTPLSAGDTKLLPGRAVLVTVDCVRGGVAQLRVLCETSDNQVVGVSRKLEVRSDG